MVENSAAIVTRKPRGRARVTNGSRLLPSVDGRSVWGRIFADCYAALVNHCGGGDYISEPRRLMARRAALLEVELTHLEDTLARVRAEGATPDYEELDFYARMAAQQRRLFEALGLERKAKDVTPDPLAYARSRQAEDADS
jgi:hypothetical protein